jgi:tetratricopeptide (TPR) repeat protein
MWFAGVRRSQQRIDEAIELFHESLRVDPLGKIPYANLPALYALRGQNDVALDLYVKAVEIHPDWPTAYQNLGIQLNGLGRMDEAVAWGMKGGELTDDPIVGAPLVLAYMEFGEYDKIIDIYSGVTPDHPMYEIGLSMEKALQLDFEGAAEVMENAIVGVEKPRQMQLGFLTRFTALAGDFDKARMYAEMQNPEFAADADPTVDGFSVAGLIGYAYILQNSGETERADALLELALGVVRTLPRLGVAGHGIRDVQILALQGKPLDALAALRDAIDEGFRGTVASNGWPLTIDPYLNSLRGQPGFEAMLEELDDAVNEMHQRVLQSEQSGNWDELRALVGGS